VNHKPYVTVLGSPESLSTEQSFVTIDRWYKLTGSEVTGRNEPGRMLLTVGINWGYFSTGSASWEAEALTSVNPSNTPAREILRLSD